MCEININIDSEISEKAYKKLKSAVYFDKTLLRLRDKIVNYETKGDIQNKLGDLFKSLESDNDANWNKTKNKILKSIKVLVFPKKIKESKEKIITNVPPDKIIIEELQYFIDLNVEGHILSVIWIFLIGTILDENMYQHSYGNRLRKSYKKDYSNSNITYSPHLFEPYFSQYESWRNNGLSVAKEYMEKENNVAIMMLDFKRFFYSVDVSEDFMKNILDLGLKNIEKSYETIYKRLNDLMYGIIKKYSNEFKNCCLEQDNAGERNILPIGFLPSNILSNWFLNNFDKAISDGWNPLYYGRYVDDIIVVEKIEENSSLLDKLNASDNKDDIIMHYFFEQCSRWKGYSDNCANHHEFSLFKKQSESDNNDDFHCSFCSLKKTSDLYMLSKQYHIDGDDTSEIKVQNDKLKFFYFDYKSSKALISCFENEIKGNASEFRYLPDGEELEIEDDYSKIFSLNQGDSIHKLRDVKSISLNKFEFSKILGKSLKLSSLVKDREESKFQKDINEIFDKTTIISNYLQWERVIEIFVVNNNFELLETLIERIIATIDDSYINNLLNSEDQGVIEKKIRKSLFQVLRAAIAGAFSLNYTKNSFDFLEKIQNYFKHNDTTKQYFEADKINSLRKKYNITRMTNKYIMPFLIDAFCSIVDDDQKKGLNLTDFNSISIWLNQNNNIDSNEVFNLLSINKYMFHPYIVSISDISVYQLFSQLLKGEKSNLTKRNIKHQKYSYLFSNYRLRPNLFEGKLDTSKFDAFKLAEIAKIHIDSPDKSLSTEVVKVGQSRKDQLKIAIANVRLEEINFKKALTSNPNRSSNRFKEFANVINLSIKQHADLLVLPESFTPFEWLPTLSQKSAQNQMAIVTGIEHLKIGENVFNLTATILPFKEKDVSHASIFFHLKNHYAPAEKELIEGYRLNAMEGNHYHLFSWDNIWFPVYCCFEVASIQDRALFQSYADILVAVEWNKDTPYYSNIIESLSRDLHCYCVQVNSSNYGDSRITQPSKTATKDILRTKGGSNSTVLLETIDVSTLRDFQFKEYSLQQKDKTFKPTSPDLNKNIVKQKIDGTLFQNIKYR